jgi:hypothetical protein
MRPIAVMFISSPYQAINAIDAIRHYDLENPEVYVINKRFESHNVSTKDILDEYGISYTNISYDGFFSFTFECAFRSITKRKKYDLVFVGDYFNPFLRMQALAKMNKNSKIIFLDDGNSTIEALMFETDYARMRGISYVIKIRLVELFENVYGKKRDRTFFTIFDKITNPKYNVVTNTQNVLTIDYTHRNNPIDIILVLGSSLSDIGYVERIQYNQKLKSIFQTVKKLTDIPIYYNPHRAEDIVNLKHLIDLENIILFNSSSGVELHLLVNNYNPYAVIGFGSTAIFTIKQMFPKCIARTVSLPIVDIDLSNMYNIIEEYYERNDVPILQIESEKCVENMILNK